jgi:FG-GAP-like repeat
MLFRLISVQIFFAYTVCAQFNYSIDQTIPVEINGSKLLMPWAGGINAAQINTLDLNGDNNQDLVIFDRTANKLLTFLNQNNQYVYAPDYETLFPAEIDQWLLLRDLNCDGKKDIFTSDPFGMVAYINTTKPGGTLSWRPYNPTAQNYPRPISTRGFSGSINVKINAADIPVIDDIDGDGDLDILNFYFIGAGTVEHHQNFALENTGRCDSLQLQRVSQNWGGFTECVCGVVSFAGGKTCAELLNGGRVEHNGGKALLSLDLNNDGAKEILLSEETCSNLFLLNNLGTSSAPVFAALSSFPTANPLSLLTYPVPWLEDIDFDGLKDIIVSPNISVREYFGTNFENSMLQFKNTGTQQTPQFNFVKSNFLQNEMIDVGDYSVPALFDYDGDGDQDLFVSNYVKTNLSSQIYQFENVGTSTNPSFKLINEDFFQLSLLNIFNLKIQFADINRDAKPDLVFSYTLKRNRSVEMSFLANSSFDKFVVTDATVKPIDFTFEESENWLIVDVEQDGINDILLGTSTGAIEYWKNNGSSNFTLSNASYLGIGTSTGRQNLTMAVADLDADGGADLILANQKGILSIYDNFRTSSTPNGITSILNNKVTNQYESRNLGGRVWTTIGNLYNTQQPSIIVGTTLGGLMVLKFEDAAALPANPEITIFPNPIQRTTAKPINIRVDRAMSVQFFSLLGQKMSGSYFIPANEDYPINISALPAGMYIAQFSWKGRVYTKRFIVN